MSKSDVIDISKVDVNKDPTKAKTLLEFFIMLLGKNLGLKPK